LITIDEIARSDIREERAEAVLDGAYLIGGSQVGDAKESVFLANRALAAESLDLLLSSEQSIDITAERKYQEIGDFLSNDRKALADLETLVENAGARANEVLGNLYDLVKDDLHDSALQNRRLELVSTLISESARPSEEKRQGDYASCVIASGVHRYAKANPAAYVEMVRDLAIEGRTTLADGKTDIYYNSRSINETANRGLAESIVQSSAMKTLGIGPSGTFCADAELFFEALFDQAFVRMDHSSGAGLDVSQGLLEKLENSNGKNMVSLRWSSGSHTYHALEITGVVRDEGGGVTHVLFRNPWGKVEGDLPVNAAVTNAEESVYQMSVKEFSSRLNYALVPGEEADRGVTAGSERIDQRGASVFGLLLILRMTEEKSKKSLDLQPKAKWNKQDNGHYDLREAATSDKERRSGQVEGPRFNWRDDQSPRLEEAVDTAPPRRGKIRL